MKIDSFNAQAGMKLAKDIILPGGGILFPRTHLLTDSDIDLIMRKGIIEIEIHGENEPEEIPEITPPPQSVSDTPNVNAFIKVRIEKSGMIAQLIIEPFSAVNPGILSKELLTKALSDSRVTFGIDEAALDKVVTQWEKQPRRYELKNAAAGLPAQPGQEGDINMVVQHLQKANEIEAVKNAQNFWQVEHILLEYERIDPGKVIAIKDPPIPPKPGKNVFGETLKTSEIVPGNVLIDGGAGYSSDNDQIIAQITGICYRIGNKVGVLPLTFDGSFVIETQPNQMEAILKLLAAGEGGSLPKLTEITSELTKMGIIFGIKKEVLHDLAVLLKNGRYSSEPILIAEGLAPVNGKDGYLEFFFSTETSLKPKVNPDGSVDYKNVDIIHTVKEGTPLCKVSPPTPGSIGKDIYGHDIPFKPGNSVKLPLGQNTAIKNGESNVLCATKDGIVKFNGSTVDVFEGYVIAGNVDFSTGNVKYEKSVAVQGDIKSGFIVECGGDLQVDGIIEDCKLTIGGNILCKYGFVGQGKGIIEAKGDVNLGFMKNQTVKSRKSVNIAKEALSSTIYSRQAIIIHGSPISVAGGTLIARDCIVLNTVGNQSGIKTHLEIGLDYVLEEELKSLDAHSAELLENQSHIMQASNKPISTKSESTKYPSITSNLRDLMAKYDEKLKILEQRRNTILNRLYHYENIYIRIERSAMPGTLIKIGERHLFLKEELIGPKTITFANHEIKII